MRKFLMILFLFPSMAFAQDNLSILMKETPEDNSLKIPETTCGYLTSQYLVNKDYVIYESCQSRKIFKPNISSFKTIEKGLAIDKDAVYIEGKPLKISTNNFTHISTKVNQKIDYIWSNSKQIYHNHTPLSNVDVATFENIKNSNLFKDKNNVYLLNLSTEKIEKVNGISASNFNYFQDNFFHDGKQLYHLDKAMTFEGKPVEVLTYMLAKTNEHLLLIDYETKTLKIRKTVDLPTLKILSDEYLVDKNGVYYLDKFKDDFRVISNNTSEIATARVLKGKVNTLLLIGQNIYYRGKIVQCPNLDVTQLKVLSNSVYFTDENNIYTYSNYEGKIIPISVTKKELKDFVIADYFDNNYSAIENIIFDNKVYSSFFSKVYDNISPEVKSALINDKAIIRDNAIIVPDEILDENKELYIYKNNLYVKNEKISIVIDKWKRISNQKNFFSYENKLFIFEPFTSVFDIENMMPIELGGLFKLETVDINTLNILPNYTENKFITDKDYLYIVENDKEYHQLISSNKLEFLGHFSAKTGYILDDVYFLFKNKEGYWLIARKNAFFSKKFLGNTLSNDWNSGLPNFSINK